MGHFEQVITKRWVPILQEYERIKGKETGRNFRLVKDLCAAHRISSKELQRYHRKWAEGGKRLETLLPQKRGPKPGSRRTRDIVKCCGLRN